MSRSRLWSGRALLPLLFCLGCTSFPHDRSALDVGRERPEPELPPAQAARANLAAAREFEKKGFEAEAIIEYEKARQNNPRLTEVSRRLAVLYDRQGNDPHALAEYQQALQSSPRDAELLNDFGYFHYSRGRLGEAEKLLRQAVALNPHQPRAWVNLGLTLGKQGRTGESLEAFQHALPPAQAYANVGILLAQQGKTDEARSALHQALTLDASLPQARAVLAYLDHSPSPPYITTVGKN